jgi:hypothetical protein
MEAMPFTETRAICCTMTLLDEVGIEALPPPKYMGILAPPLIVMTLAITEFVGRAAMEFALLIVLMTYVLDESPTMELGIPVIFNV